MRQARQENEPSERDGTASHLRIDAEAWADIWLVGDIHGCVDELETLLDRLDPAADDLVVFVGDLVRKGPDSAAVVDLVRSRDNLRSVLGNNERKLLAGEASAGLDSDAIAYLESLPLTLEFDDCLVVHGGLDPRQPVDDQPPEALLTMRSVPPGRGYDGPFWFDRYEGPPRVFFGHTVVDEPVIDPHAVALDTGCVYGGALSAYAYRDDEIVQVPAKKPYRPRPDAKIHSPA